MTTTPPSPTSRTVTIAKLGLAAELLLGLVLLVALALVGGEQLAAVCETIATLAVAMAAIATGGSVAHGGRHWGAREPSR